MPAFEVQMKDLATPALNKAMDEMRGPGIKTVAGREAVDVVRKHLVDYNRQHPNKLGGERKDFYQKAAAATNFAVVPEGALVSINKQGIRQRYEGGTIEPVDRDFLTIPARAEAYGHLAREFNDLRVMFGKGGKPVALVQPNQIAIKPTGKKRKDGSRRFKAAEETGGVMFWLVRSVTQRGDKAVLPDEKVIGERVVRAVTGFLDARLQ